tara:strand:- start:485 stop:1096 length:612 start_codon:yes stop_codon:yes gene_type:complete
MGLPGSGKTFLAKKLVKSLKADWLNSDRIRGKYKDWDFSNTGIIRQVTRMKNLANQSKKKFVVADFICPIQKQFEIFKPNIVVWMDTIKVSRYPRINRIFKKPKKYDVRVTNKNADLWILAVLDKVILYKWKKSSIVRISEKFKPWRAEHSILIKKALLKYGQVNLQIKNVRNLRDNPYNFKNTKRKILKNFKYFEKRIKISK